MRLRTEGLYRTRAFRSIPSISFVVALVGLRPMEFTVTRTPINKFSGQCGGEAKPRGS
jgi:hypothetical protein